MNKYQITGFIYIREWVSEILNMKISTQNKEEDRQTEMGTKST